MAALDRSDEADAISTKVLDPMDSRDKYSWIGNRCTSCWVAS
jgi:hypothetical protein